jgi:hypothetical protein
MSCKTAELGKAYSESVSTEAKKISDPSVDKLTGVFVMHSVGPAVGFQVVAQEFRQVRIVRSYSAEAYEMVKPKNSGKTRVLLRKTIIPIQGFFHNHPMGKGSCHKSPPSLTEITRVI